jgi:hypothetical protein
LAVLILALGFVSWRIINPPIQRVMIFAGPKGQAYERAGMALEEALQATGLFEVGRRLGQAGHPEGHGHRQGGR